MFDAAPVPQASVVELVLWPFPQPWSLVFDDAPVPQASVVEVVLCAVPQPWSFVFGDALVPQASVFEVVLCAFPQPWSFVVDDSPEPFGSAALEDPHADGVFDHNEDEFSLLDAPHGEGSEAQSPLVAGASQEEDAAAAFAQSSEAGFVAPPFDKIRGQNLYISIRTNLETHMHSRTTCGHY